MSTIQTRALAQVLWIDWWTRSSSELRVSDVRLKWMPKTFRWSTFHACLPATASLGSGWPISPLRRTLDAPTESGRLAP